MPLAHLTSPSAHIHTGIIGSEARPDEALVRYGHGILVRWVVVGARFAGVLSLLQPLKSLVQS